MPFDVALAMDDGFCLAWIVARGENEGGRFDWERMAWDKQG